MERTCLLSVSRPHSPEPGITSMAIEPHRLVTSAAVSGEDRRLRSTWGSWRELGASLIRVASLHEG